MIRFEITTFVEPQDADEFQFAFEKWFDENGFTFAIVREEMPNDSPRES